MLDRITHLIAQSKRNESSFALLYIDLDNFKTINDTKGHAFGDQILAEAALRLQQSIRDSDTVARVGGDEFVLVLEKISNKEKVSAMAEVLLETLNKPFVINDEEVLLGCSVGIELLSKVVFPRLS